MGTRYLQFAYPQAFLGGQFLQRRPQRLDLCGMEENFEIAALFVRRRQPQRRNARRNGQPSTHRSQEVIYKPARVVQDLLV